jgi:hypothetical protein
MLDLRDIRNHRRIDSQLDPNKRLQHLFRAGIQDPYANFKHVESKQQELPKQDNVANHPELRQRKSSGGAIERELEPANKNKHK